MARTSRKQAGAETGMEVPERIYHAAAYVRLSVEDNNRAGDQESISMQRYMLEKYIAQQPDMLLWEVYSDNGESGTDFKRPGFERMMEEVRKRAVDCIVVKDLSRFGRNYVEAGYYLEKIFPYLGVRFVAVNDNYDTLKGKDGNELVLSLKNLANDLYAKDISQKISSALSIKQKNGEFIGTFPPYGYLKSPEDKHKLAIDPDAAPVVRDIFRWRLEGAGNIQIARLLNNRKVPSPSMYHYQKGHRKKKPEGASAIWQGQVIKRITANPVYAGHMAQGKTKRSLSQGILPGKVPCDGWIVVKDTHEALVSQETFSRVQEIAKERCRGGVSLQGRHQAAENVFKGLVICGDCGTKMTRYKRVSRAGKARYNFTCRVYAENLGGQGCALKGIGEQELKGAVLLALYVQIKLARGMEKILECLQGMENLRKKRGELSGKRQKAERKIRRNAALRSSLFESYCSHALTEEEYLSMKAGCDRKAQELAAELEQIRQENREYGNDIFRLEEWTVFSEECREEKILTHEMAAELIRHIRVLGCNEIEITWNFQDEFAHLAAGEEQ